MKTMSKQAFCIRNETASKHTLVYPNWHGLEPRTTHSFSKPEPKNDSENTPSYIQVWVSLS